MSLAAKWLPVALACSLVGCFSLGPIWAPRVEGRVVDAATGEPVAGAEVFASYSTAKWDTKAEWLTSDVTTDSTWATTDRDGRFVLPAHVAVQAVPGGCATAKYPWLMVHHPAYGAMDWPNNVSYPEQDAQKKRQFWRDLVIEIKPWKRVADAPPVRVTGSMLHHCRWANLTPAACERLCEVSVGVAACERYDVESAELQRQEAAERAATQPKTIVNPFSPTVSRPRIVPSR